MALFSYYVPFLVLLACSVAKDRERDPAGEAEGQQHQKRALPPPPFTATAFARNTLLGVVFYLFVH